VGGVSALVIGIAYIIILPLFAHVGWSSVGEWRGLAEVPRRKDDVLVGYSLVLCVLHGLSLRTCRVVAIRCVGHGSTETQCSLQPHSWDCSCPRHGSYLEQLRLAPHAQRFTIAVHDRRPAGGLRRGCNYASAVLASHTEFSYSIVDLSVAILITDYVMLQGKGISVRPRPTWAWPQASLESFP